MAIKPKTKKTAAKKATPAAKKTATPTAKAATPTPAPTKKSAAPKERAATRHSRMKEMLLGQKHTDQEIFDALTAEFGSCHRPGISICRWTLNKALSKDSQLEPLFREGGKLVRASERAPKEPKRAASKAKAARETLDKLGLKTSAPKKAVKKAAKKAATSAK